MPRIQRPNKGTQNMARRVKQPHGGELRILEKGETANPHGRPPLLLTKITRRLSGEGYERVSGADMEAHLSVLFGLPMSQIEEMANDDRTPLATRIICSHLMQPKDRLSLLSYLLDRAHGKAKQSITATVTEVPRPMIVMHTAAVDAADTIES